MKTAAVSHRFPSKAVFRVTMVHWSLAGCWVSLHPSGVLRNLLILPRAFDILSKHKKLMGAKGLWNFLKASLRLMHTGTCSVSGLGFLTAYGGFELTWTVKVRGKVHKGVLALK